MKRTPTKASVRDSEKPKPITKSTKTKRNISVFSKSNGKALPYFILDGRCMDAEQLKRIGEA
jgi:hypothetical protein